MENLLLLFVCLSLGVVLGRGKVFPPGAHHSLNAFVINVSLSALCLYYIPKITISTEILLPVAVAWINIALAFLIFHFLGPRLGFSRAVTGAVVLCVGFGNTSFVGIPVISALYGPEAIKTVMLVDQPGSFVALSTVGIFLVNFYSGKAVGVVQSLRRIFSFPPFLMFLLALLMALSGLSFPKTLDSVFSSLGATTVPLALVSVGLQLKVERWHPYEKPLLLGLLFKLLLFPLFIFILYRHILGVDTEMAEVAIMESAMGPMITASILASSYGLAPRLCNLFIGVGIPLSLLTLYAWHLLL